MRRIFHTLAEYAVRMMLIMVVFTSIILVMAMIYESPTMYIQRRIGFWCCQMPVREYSYDAYDHGREVDRIDVFELRNYDAERFANFANSSAEWNSLPLNSNTQFHGMSDLGFDQHMEDMITCQTGYWYSSDNHPRTVCVFDSENNKLFIRMRTW